MKERQKDNWTKAGQPKKPESNLEKIREINRKALAAGMSYGKYVAKHGGGEG